MLYCPKRPKPNRLLRVLKKASIDLLRKPLSGEHGVVDSGQEIETEVESAPMMVIDARQALEDFEAADHLFHRQASTGQCPVFSLLLGGGSGLEL